MKRILCGLMAIMATCSLHASKDLRLGIIGLDTSHVVAFTKILNDQGNPQHVKGARVVAAFKGGSPDIPSSRDRIDRFTKTLVEDYDLKLYPSIEAMCKNVDAVLLESVDGRPHLEQAQKLVIKGEGAKYRLGPDTQEQLSTQAEVENGLAAAVNEKIDDVEGKGLRVGTLNYDIWERNSYRKKMYYTVYGKVAPSLPDFTREDPFQVDEPAINEKNYTEKDRFEFDKWLANRLKKSDSELESTVFGTIDDNIELKHWEEIYSLLETMAESYAATLDESRALIKELINSEQKLEVINEQIKELEST